MPEVSQERLMKDLRRILENPFWIDSLETNTTYSRLHDDRDGTKTGSINVIFSEDGDTWIKIEHEIPGGSLRFRNDFGGGESLRVRNALIMLALAIDLDNQERPQ